MIDLRQERVNQLFARGASLSVAHELLPLTASRFATGTSAKLNLPLTSEPHVATWQTYVNHAAQQGAWATLRQRLVQLQFPVRAGISTTVAYQHTTRQGAAPNQLAGATGLELEASNDISLAIVPTAVGGLPVITCAARHDFIALAQALVYRNEPAAIPDAVGALLISGYINWNRISGLRADWPSTVHDSSDAAWATELREHIRPLPQLYRDSFVLCSSGPYSGVSPSVLGLAPDEWRIASQAIRIGHEATHYTVQRLLGPPENSLIDELVADCCGIIAAGRPFSAEWFLHFMGLDCAPDQRPAGRLVAYLDSTKISPEAFGLLSQILAAAARNLERVSLGRSWPIGAAPNLAHLTIVLMQMSLEELAADDAPQRIESALDDMPQTVADVELA